MKLVGWIVLAIFAAGLLVAGCVALVNDEDSMAPVRAQLVSHERERCYDGDCGDQSYDQWRNEDRNRNRNRNRGAFSPGPFDDSPVDAFNGNVICLPGSTCYSDDRRRDENPPPEEQRTRSEDVLCTLRNLPYHCDAKPEGTS